MKKFKKQLICFAAFFLLIQGCSKKDDNKITVTFWHSFVSSTIPALDQLIKDFEKENPSIKINAQYIPTGDALVEKLITAIQSNTAPDISWIHEDFIDKLVESDAIYDMNFFINGNDSLTQSEINDIYPQLLKNFTHKNVLYAMPMEATVLALIYNKDHFKAAGLNPDHSPKDWKELREYAKKLTIDKDGDGKIDQYGFYVPAFPASGPLSIWMVLQWSPFLWQAGGKIINSNQTEVLFNSEAGVKALTLWKNIYDDLNFSNYSFTHDMGFASGSLSMIMDGPWDLPTFRKMENVNWAVAPLPKGPVKKATYMAGEGMAVFKQSKHPGAAWKFIKWVIQPEVQAKFSMNSGYLPIRKSVLEMTEYQNFLEKDSAMKNFIEQLSYAQERPSIDKYYVNINQIIAGAIEKTLLGNMDSKKSLNEAAKKSNELLKINK